MKPRSTFVRDFVFRLGIAALSASAYSTASASGSCLQEIPVVLPAQKGAERSHGTLVSEGKEVFPDYVKRQPSAPYPLVHSLYPLAQRNGARENRTPVWSFGPDARELVGPHDTGFILKTDPRGGFAADDKGVLLMIGGRSSDSTGIAAFGSPQRWHTSLFTQGNGSAPQPLATSLQEALDYPRAVFWSRILDGFVISSWRGGPVLESRTSVLRGGQVKPLMQEQGADLVEDLPRFGVAALLFSRTLAFVDREERVMEVTRLNSGDDYSGWEELYETRDDGWLYVRGVQYDHAVRVDKEDDQWRATSIVRVIEDDGRFNGFMRAVLGMPNEQMRRDGLAKIFSAGTCRRFSTAVRRMIFCNAADGVMREMRAGDLVDIEGHGKRLTDFLGDADRLGVALFRDWTGRVHAYDGERLHAVAGATLGSRGLVHDLSRAGRTFVATFGGVFEVKGSATDKLEIVQLDVPQSRDYFFTRFVEAGDGNVFAFLRDGIYLVGSGQLERRWAANEPIDITGHTIPTDVPGWGGTLFTTRAKIEGGPRFHLLSSCPAQGG
jgi:hypothetical protein